MKPQTFITVILCLFLNHLFSQTLNSITILPSNPNVGTSTIRNLKAIGTYSNGTSNDITSSVTWQSSNTSALTISNSSGSQGVATGGSIGTSTVSATSGMVVGNTIANVVIDADGDMVPESSDHCKYIPNSNQLESDTDGIGDVCDCMFNIPNPLQRTVQDVNIYAFPNSNITPTTVVHVHAHLTYINMPNHDPQPTYTWFKNNVAQSIGSFPNTSLTGLFAGDIIKCEISQGVDCVAGGSITSNTFIVTGNGTYVGINTNTPSTDLDVNGGFRTKYSGSYLDNGTYTANSAIQTITIALIPALPVGWTNTNTVALVSNVDGVECQVVQANITSVNTLKVSFVPANSGSNPRFNYVILKI